MFRSFFSIVLQLVSQQMVHQAVEMAHQAVKAPLAPKQMKETLVTVQIAHPMQIKPLVSNTTNRHVFNSLIFFLNILILSLFSDEESKNQKETSSSSSLDDDSEESEHEEDDDEEMEDEVS